MMDYEKIRKVLEDKTGLAKFNASRSNIIMYCPWCEKDSKKNHGHLYLECATGNQMPVFHCFKCEDKNPSKGTLLKLLRVLGISPNEYIPTDILKSKGINRRSDYYNKELRNIKVLVKKQNLDNYKLKRQYLHSRLGFDYDLERIPRLILNIREFIRENKIDLGERKKFLEYYERSFVGFLSDYGSILILRNIDNNSSFRYVKIPLSNNKNFFKDMYSIKIRNPRETNNTIILCEGVFDLLVAINSVELQNLKNMSCLCAAVLGCGYKKIIPTSLDACKLTAANFVILSDIDKNENYYYKFKQDPSVLNVNIYWNKYGDDFGKLPIRLSSKIL